MKIIENGIVFSNDINRILKGNNSLDFNYQENGIMLPKKEIYTDVRKDFKEDAKKIFNGQVTIIEEEEMTEGLITSISDCLGRYPHCFIR